MIVPLLFLLYSAPVFTHAATCVDGKVIDDDGNDTGQTCDPEQDSAAAPYDFKNEGIFGCNQVAGANASAGTMAAIGGVYVPVNDAAVTLNTGILVYKECVLRPLQNRLRESAMSALLKKQYIGVETGREGNKRYVVDIDDELLVVDDRAALTYLTGPTLETVHPAYREQVKRVLAVKYRAETRGTGKQECGYAGDLVMATQNPTENEFDLANFAELRDPSCNLFFEYMDKKDELDAARATAKANQMTMWDWGRGFYAVTDNAQDPSAEKILTPSSVVQESYQQILGSSVRQLENSNDIGQMIGALFAGVTTQALTDSRGLSGLSKSVAGRPSYLDQVAKESSQGVIGAAVNAALTILNSARQVESNFLAIMNAIAKNLTDTINQIRGVERQCWSLVVPKVREYAAQGTCVVTDPTTNPPTTQCTPFQLNEAKISAATSSLAFSQQVIDSQISPLAQAALTNVQSSQKALGLIDQLIAGVTNTASLTAQRLALQQLDSLVAQRALHSQYDVVNATKQRDDILSAMENLRTDTAKAWGDSPDPATGWCNIQNPDVIKQWAERWKK
ncbi:hypothetical protein A3B35_01730 [Candidatus Kaiserbacteria bacterium RIFCSPLOWO2_01_FULL_54_24]|uniref:Uncharacterized protein n=1 Tax=Candidatus Kaiserbacteria bacterium RIFCSPLOWO2_01_FULL_54_24 TaxID=1798515 RepID=A0A1F6EVB2_9BACT|nr:MAG: hypothetical protein A3B35_01730 [Candidatus Kaiserbacteria bacterium RIFCSPLOWO2_01_FULL_54_24]